jgi:hypothetical protein
MLPRRLRDFVDTPAWKAAGADAAASPISPDGAAAAAGSCAAALVAIRSASAIIAARLVVGLFIRFLVRDSRVPLGQPALQPAVGIDHGAFSALVQFGQEPGEIVEHEPRVHAGARVQAGLGVRDVVRHGIREQSAAAIGSAFLCQGRQV